MGTTGEEFSSVLRKEIQLLRPQAEESQRTSQDCADRARLVGLALSGGGIRSAVFSLGLIRALTRLRMLRGFDYLSTVSGGGYLGAWLSALIHRTRKPGQSADGALAELEQNLSGEQHPWGAPDAPPEESPPEHPSIRFFRRYCNYLTPRLGLLSGDSLAAIVTYLRNLLVNQLTLVSFFAALLTVPYLLLRLSHWLIDPAGLGALERPLLQTGLSLLHGLAILPMGLAVIVCGLSLMQMPERDRLAGIKNRTILLLIVLPLLIAAWMLALVLATHDRLAGFTLLQWVWTVTLLYFVDWVLALVLKIKNIDPVYELLKKFHAMYLARKGKPGQLLAAFKDTLAWVLGLVHFLVSFLWQVPWIVISGGLGGLLLHWLNVSADKLPALGRVEYAVAFGPPLILLIFLAVVTVQIGLVKRLYSENDREWWARLGGMVLLTSAGWGLSFAVTLFSPPLVAWLAGLAVAGGLGWIATSVAGVLVGKSPLTGPEGSLWRKILALIAPHVFLLGLAIVLACLLNAVLTGPTRLCPDCETIKATSGFRAILEASLRNLGRIETSDLLWSGGVCLAVFGLLGWRVDINLFSLHHFYSNRLVRCFLGATRIGSQRPLKVERAPHPFTGFDPKDDLPLADLHDQRPWPIINATMNIAGGVDLAWQTRRAASFAFTPGHTGYEFWRSHGDRIGAYRPTRETAANQFKYRDTRICLELRKAVDALGGSDARFDFLNPSGGVFLGSAIATSGAAANPNMGYHTSAPLSALMSVFNVRLGRWCGNPRHSSAWTRISPRFGGLSLLQEMFGLLTFKSPFLNISDGGHFENLGIYELIRRRCHVIVSVDAGCDPGYTFEDLANAIRKCWTDFGVRIDIDTAALKPGGASHVCTSHYAVGKIYYPNAPDPGVLIYIKASTSGDESIAVREYADNHAQFPHESTRDQFFDENQFESYCELGRHIGEQVFSPLIPRQMIDAERMTPEQIRARIFDRMTNL